MCLERYKCALGLKVFLPFYKTLTGALNEVKVLSYKDSKEELTVLLITLYKAIETRNIS